MVWGLDKIIEFLFLILKSNNYYYYFIIMNMRGFKIYLIIFIIIT